MVIIDLGESRVQRVGAVGGSTDAGCVDNNGSIQARIRGKLF